MKCDKESSSMKNPDNHREPSLNSHLRTSHLNSIIHLNEKTDKDKELEFIAEYFTYWAILDVALFIAIVVGNVLVILAVRLTRKLRHVSSNLFVLNLAIADLIVGFTLAYHLAFYMHKELGQHKMTCITRFVVAILGCSSSMFSLMAIAVDRYIGVMHPLQYAQHVTQTNVVITIFIGWFSSIAISTVPLYLNCFDRGLVCEFQSVLERYYVTSVLCPLISVIWLSLLFLYWKILRVAKSHTRRLREIGFGDPCLDDCKGSKAVLAILGCFTLCWLPYLMVVCMRLWTVKSTEVLYKALFSLAMANSGMNPIIYACKNTQFRQAFHYLLRFRNPNHNDFNENLNKYLEKQKQLTERASA